MEIKGCRVLITGSAKRVGKKIAVDLARLGATVILHAFKSRNEAAETASEIEAFALYRPMVVHGDVSLRETWTAMDGEIEKHHGGLDVWVHNAAVFSATPFFSTSEEDWQQFMDVNLKGAFFGAQVLGERMKQTGRGKIIAIGDVAAELAWASYIPYSVSKAGMHGLMRGLARLLAPEVQVNVVAPGPVLLPDGTKDAERHRIMQTIPLQRIGEPADVSKAVRFLLESDYVTGQVIRVDGGRSGLRPGVR
ncbi:MAG: SDR family oxidoreductase [Acidobacteria bacterium]|nr:SDR family oxidoreductase [Acidobacteriota bacterium]